MNEQLIINWDLNAQSRATDRATSHDAIREHVRSGRADSDAQRLWEFMRTHDKAAGWTMMQVAKCMPAIDGDKRGVDALYSAMERRISNLVNEGWAFATGLEVNESDDPDKPILRATFRAREQRL